MKFTLSWLKDHLETDASLNDIVETLTRIGLEVEHVTDPADTLKNFVVGHVLDAQPHPDADRLRVCMVDIGAGAPIRPAGLTKESLPELLNRLLDSHTLNP